MYPFHYMRQFSTKRLSSACTLAIPPKGRTLAYKYLGHVPYKTALHIQQITVHSLQSQIGNGPVPNVLYLVQHPPVYTAGRRIRNTDNNEVTRLQNLGAEYIETQRGGETTFHGPGQLVGYPIVHLKQFNMTVRCYVSLLETTLIHLCRHAYGIDAKTDIHTGVFVGNNKIAALGVHVSRYVTLHGFALNVNTDLSWYSHITPCGITDRGVTSLESELGTTLDDPVTVESTIPFVVKSFQHVWGVSLSHLSQSHPEWNSHIDEIIQSGVSKH